ncbi:haloacid dehalogenase [Azorhizobium oxalatiphilum]|uniref:Haloacid dehalogenase n=1 Tax=Azorhizobium oxalatiphilum TaxID=980631 RepID=A0A917C9T0_9HYPH|nr:TIGR01459 family HAD-type hydrolase [Azorhizobium oxalatiphilum]GGF80556.1 haloacid dehalogenase [Azorhizobium oxalatiphilum]
MAVAPPLLSGLSEIVSDYDLILCDVWGVIHNGISAFPATGDALTRARDAGLTVLLVSNAPRPNAFVAKMLDGMGVPRTAYDGIVTSGDVTRAVLAARPGARIFHLGPSRDLGTYDGLDVTVTDLPEADLVVCTGLLNDEVETPEDYRDMLTGMRARDLPFICANPDLVVERGDRLIYCAGALAQLYDELGGSSVYCGKPHAPVYAEALKRLEAMGRPVPAPKRVLAIGDALRTDIIGAAGAGFDGLFISSGIHAVELASEHGAPPDMDAVAKLFADGPSPRAVMPRLSW